jgi:hypothetical protein
MNSSTSSATGMVSNSTPPMDPSYQGSGTKPGFGNGSAPPYAADPERALNDLARREQILAVQVKAHRFCIAQLEDERARFEAERATGAARATDEAKARAREELARQLQDF